VEASNSIISGWLSNVRGLGIGITANYFDKCGNNVTAIEIDPVVYQFAEEYFGLRKLRVLHQDGRKFVQDAEEMWDIVIHDVFSGGSVPGSLFTLEMWEAVRRVLKEKGVLAVVFCIQLHRLTQNFLGLLGDPSVDSIVATLLASFEFCRLFKDPFAPVDQSSNMVWPRHSDSNSGHVLLLISNRFSAAYDGRRFLFEFSRAGFQQIPRF
jgi:Spermine/spermidine synthase domain